MRLVTAVGLAAMLVGLGVAQDRVAKEDTEKYAKLCVDALSGATDSPLTTEGDPTKAIAVRGEGGGAMVVPDKRLTADRLTRVGKDVVPVGQLWLRKWVPVSGGKPTTKDRLRVVTVRADGQDRPMPVLLLGVRKTDAGGLELVVYAKDADPLLTLPLKRVEFVPDGSIDLAWERGRKNIDQLTVTLFGQLQTVVPVTRQ